MQDSLFSTLLKFVCYHVILFQNKQKKKSQLSFWTSPRPNRWTKKSFYKALATSQCSPRWSTNFPLLLHMQHKPITTLIWLSSDYSWWISFLKRSSKEKTQLLEKESKKKWTKKKNLKIIIHLEVSFKCGKWNWWLNVKCQGDSFGILEASWQARSLNEQKTYSDS